MKNNVFKERYHGLPLISALSTREKFTGRKMNHFPMSKPILRPYHRYLTNFQSFPKAIHGSRVKCHTTSLQSVTLWIHSPKVTYIGIERYQR